MFMPPFNHLRHIEHMKELVILNVLYDYVSKKKVPIIRMQIGIWNEIYPETEDGKKVICSTCSYLVQDAEESTNKAGQKVLVCPQCKKQIRGNIHYKKNFKQHVYMSKVVDKEDKLHFYLTYFSYAISKKSNRMYCEPHFYTFTYNKETKHLYIIKKMNSKHVVAPITFGTIPKWANELYRLIFNNEIFDKYALRGFEIFKNELKKNLPHWVRDRELNLCSITTILKEPSLSLIPNIEQLEKLGYGYKLIPKTKKKLIKGKASVKELISIITGYTPNKFDMKFISRRSDNLMFYPCIKELFKDVNNQQAIFKELDKQNYWLDREFESFERHMLFFNFKKFKSHIEDYFSFLCLFDLKKLYKDEIKFKNHIIKYFEKHDLYQLLLISQDIVRMNENIKNRIDTKNEIKNHYHKLLKEFKSIQTLHDELINIINLMKFGCENKIDYKGETRKVFESNFLPDYKFELAESDLQIYQVGHKFNNCLGGYVDEAMEQRVFILFLRNKVTEEIEYAMEVSPNKVLYQAEGKYNQLPPENVWEIIKKYCDEKGIRIPTERAA